MRIHMHLCFLDVVTDVPVDRRHQLLIVIASVLSAFVLINLHEVGSHTKLRKAGRNASHHQRLLLPAPHSRLEGNMSSPLECSLQALPWQSLQPCAGLVQGLGIKFPK